MGTKFKCCTPVLTVSDLTDARNFFADKLGFSIAFEWSDPPTYIGVTRDGIDIHLMHSGVSRQPAGSSNINVLVEGVDDYFAHCRQEGVEIVTALGDRPYGLRDFAVQDTDGNILNFGGEIRSRGNARK